MPLGSDFGSALTVLDDGARFAFFMVCNLLAIDPKSWVNHALFSVIDAHNAGNILSKPRHARVPVKVVEANT